MAGRIGAEATPYALLGAVGALWGGLTVLAKVVGAMGIPAPAYTLAVGLGAGGALALARLAAGRRLPLDARHLRYYAFCGVVGSALPTTNMFHVLGTVPASLMALLLATAPLFTYLFALALGAERAGGRRLAGLGLGLAGVATVLAPRAGLPDPALLPWLGLALVTPALYGLNTAFAGRFRPPAADPVALTAGMLLVSGLTLVPVVAGGEGGEALARHAATLAGALVALHAALTAAAFILFFHLLGVAGPVFTGQVGYLVTLTAVGLGIALLGERPGPWLWAALALVLGGVALVRTAPAR